MAFYDWNKDGKKDFVDDYIEYNIYKDCTKNSNDDNSFNSTNSSNSSSDGAGCAFFLVIFIIGVIIELFN